MPPMTAQGNLYAGKVYASDSHYCKGDLLEHALGHAKVKSQLFDLMHRDETKAGIHGPSRQKTESREQYAVEILGRCEGYEDVG